MLLCVPAGRVEAGLLHLLPSFLLHRITVLPGAWAWGLDKEESVEQRGEEDNRDTCGAAVMMIRGDGDRSRGVNMRGAVQWQLLTARCGILGRMELLCRLGQGEPGTGGAGRLRGDAACACSKVDGGYDAVECGVVDGDVDRPTVFTVGEAGTLRVCSHCRWLAGRAKQCMRGLTCETHTGI